MKKLISLFAALFMLLNTMALADDITFSEMIVVDNEECTIKITAIDPDDWMGFALKVYLENKSSTKTYMYSVDNASINGLASDPFWATEVSPGKKANSTISFMDSTLKEQGITKYTDIELSFRVYDTDDWMADNVAEVTVHVYPYGEDKVETYSRTAQESDILLADNNDITAIVTGCGLDELWGYGVKLHLVNKTNNPVMFSVEDVSVNGFMLDPFWAFELEAGKTAASNFTWFESDFKENDISTVEEVEFTFIAYDSDSFDRLFEKHFILNP